jgi:hypothetical protein
MKGATPIIILLALCCSSSFAIPILNGIFGGSGGSGGFWGGFTSGLMNPVGGVSDLFNLAVNGTGSGMTAAGKDTECPMKCGNCSQAHYDNIESRGLDPVAQRAWCEVGSADKFGSACCPI